MNKEKIKNLTTIAIFGSLIVILQILCTFIKFGSFPITLTLIPIIISGAIYGVKMGSIMGLVFGGIVSFMVVFGLDTSGASMLAVHPFITVFACMLKGLLCGLFSSLSYKIISPKHQKVALLVSAAIAPITNTVTLFIFLILFFDSSFAIMVSTLMSINFAIEFITNVVIAPSLLSLINRGKNRFN